jgi:hypothetical protein
MPQQDRRLVFLEELKKAHPEVFSKLTETRSSGKADIPKIERGKAWARCRLIVSSNPRNGQPMAAFTYGLEAISELIPNLEDIRRFDVCMTVAQQEVTANVAQYAVLPNGKPHKPIFDGISCRNLVLWAWTRQPTEIVFEDWRYILERAGELCSCFVETVPIVDRGSMRMKLARLATALAARTFSVHDVECNKLYVRNCHVDYIVSWLHKIYCSRYFGYDKFSKAVTEQSQLSHVDQIVDRLANVPMPRTFADCLLRTQQIDLQLIMDWCAWERLEAAKLVSELVRSHALLRDGARHYKKSPQFIELLEKLQAANYLPETAKAPEYIRGQI